MRDEVSAARAIVGMLTFEYYVMYSIVNMSTNTSERRANVTDETTIRSPAQVRALIAPARQEIVDVLESAGPCSVSTLAALVGRPADALYHHLRRLVRVGLVRETERRKQGRQVFAMYDLCMRPMRISYDAPVRRRDIARVFAAAQRMSWREFSRALEAETGVTEGPRRTLWGSRAKGWATPERLTRINRLLAEVNEIVRTGGPIAGAVPIAMSFVLSPSPPADRAEERPAERRRTGNRKSTNDEN